MTKADISSDDSSASIDLLRTPVGQIQLANKPLLGRIRAAYCNGLSVATFHNLPNLEAADFTCAACLRTLKFSQCPKFRALDISSTHISALSGIETLQYLSANSASRIKFPNMPNLRLLDYSPREFDGRFKLSKFPRIEAVRLSNAGQDHFLSVYSAHQHLRSVELHQCDFVFDSLTGGTQLRFLALGQLRTCSGDEPCDNSLFIARDGNRVSGAPFDPAGQVGYEWPAAARQLVGPWGIPHVDLEPIESPVAVLRPPGGCNVDAAVDGILGAVFGGAIGDWIGVGTEFVDGSISKVRLPEPMDVTWSHAKVWRHNMNFLRGTPTDDTSQAILILRSLIDANTKRKRATDGLSVFECHGIVIDTIDFGEKLLDWQMHGHREHKHPHGLGCGATTFRTLHHPLFASNPIKAAEAVWVATDRQVAPNGSVMRISTSGCFGFWDEVLVLAVAEKFGRTTHSDPRCVFCTNAAALLISRVLQHRVGLVQNAPNIDATLEEVLAKVDGAGQHRDIILRHCRVRTLAQLKLSGNKEIGYCLKSLGAGIWALRHARSFEEGIAAIVREGGDADTNASCAGALLGAKFGLGKISKEFTANLFVGQWMWRELTPFVELMGFKMPPSPYLSP